MWITSPATAALSIAAVAAVAAYINVVAPLVPWGNVTRALIFHQVRRESCE